MEGKIWVSSNHSRLKSPWELHEPPWAGLQSERGGNSFAFQRSGYVERPHRFNTLRGRGQSRAAEVEGQPRVSGQR